MAKVRKQSEIQTLYEACPGAFALSLNEMKRLQRLGKIIDEHINPDDYETTWNVIRAELKDKISIPKAVSILDKVISSKYWFLASVPKASAIVCIKRESIAQELIVLDSSVSKQWKTKQITNIEQLAEIAGIDSSYKFVPCFSRHFDDIRLLKDVLETIGRKEKTVPVGFKLMISNNLTTCIVAMIDKADDAASLHYDEDNEEYRYVSPGRNSVILTYGGNDGLNLLKRNPSLDKMLRQISNIVYTTNSNDRRIRITLDKFMEDRNLSDKQKARNRLKKDLTDLNRIRWVLDDGANNCIGTGFISEFEYSNAVATIELTKSFWDYIHSSDNMNIEMFPTSLLAIPEDPSVPSNAYVFGAVMADNTRRNLSKPNENKITVTKLIEIGTMPKVDSIPKKKIRQTIIEPLFKALDYLITEHPGQPKALKGYKLVHRGTANTPLSAEEEIQARSDYDFLSSCAILYEWEINPPYEYIRNQKRRRADKLTIKQENERKKAEKIRQGNK